MLYNHSSVFDLCISGLLVGKKWLVYPMYFQMGLSTRLFARLIRWGSGFHPYHSLLSCHIEYCICNRMRGDVFADSASVAFGGHMIRANWIWSYFFAFRRCTRHITHTGESAQATSDTACMLSKFPCGESPKPSCVGIDV